jgi:hypothetical protein
MLLIFGVTKCNCLLLHIPDCYNLFHVANCYCSTTVRYLHMREYGRVVPYCEMLLNLTEVYVNTCNIMMLQLVHVPARS